MMSKLTSKNALITGAASGIGFATVQAFAEAGWRIFAVDQNKADQPFEGQVEFIQADLSSTDVVHNLGAQIEEKIDGGLSALINNAAVQVTGSIAELKANDWDHTMAVNLRAPYLLAQSLLSSFANPAAIVNVVSVHALATSADIAAYAASKGGLLTLTRSMAIEFAERGIRVNAVLPGAIDTAMLQKGLKRGEASAEENRKKLEERILLKRLGKPEEIAQAIFFLAEGNQSSYITGQSLVVDGGATARLSTE
jgi:glucose 1-dehydrogenase